MGKLWRLIDQRILESQYAFRIILCLGLFIGTLSLPLGFYGDDYFFFSKIKFEDDFGPSTPFTLYDFFSTSEGGGFETLGTCCAPWWHADNVSFRFLRPLASAIIYGEVKIFGDYAWLYHLHSLLWFVALIFIVKRLYEIFIPRKIGLWSLFLYVISFKVTFAVIWVANRNSVHAAVFVLSSLLCHHYWADTRKWYWRPLSMLALVLGLASTEMGATAFLVLFAYEVFYRQKSYLAWVARLWPAVLIGLCYVGLYKWGNFGTHGSGLYLNPTAEPIAFLTAAPGRFVRLFTSLFAGLPAEISLIPYPGVAAALLILTAVLAFFSARRVILLLKSKPTPSHKFFMAAALFCIIPSLAAFPMDRLLIISFVFAAPFVAQILTQLAGETSGLGRKALFPIMLFFFVVLAATQSLIAPIGMKLSADRDKHNLAFAEASQPAQEKLFLVVGNSFPQHWMLYLPMRISLDLPKPESFMVITATDFDHKITRTGTNSLTATFGGGWFPPAGEFCRGFATLIRPSYSFKTGDIIERDHLRVFIEEAAGGCVQRARFEFDRPLTPDTVDLRVWSNGEFTPIDIPQPGQELVVQGGLI